MSVHDILSHAFPRYKRAAVVQHGSYWSTDEQKMLPEYSGLVVWQGHVTAVCSHQHRSLPQAWKCARKLMSK